jgi:hypothetical protein
MTTTSTTPNATATTTQDHRRISAVAGLVSYGGAAALTVPNAHHAREALIVLAGAAVVSVVVFGWLLPRGLTKGAPSTALALSAVATVLLLPAFWSMLPLVLGVAGVMLGQACAAHAPKRGYAAVGLGALAVTGYLFIYVVLGLVMGDL